MLVLQVLFIVTVSLLPWSICNSDKYCRLCKNHTMCKYEGIGKECVDVGESGVTPKEKQEILDVHNKYRSFIASGSEERGIGGPQPKAANMNKLVWDDDLATVAQRWADQCLFQHDECREDPRWKVGQNIYLKWRKPKIGANWTEAIRAWYNEVSLFSISEVTSFRFNEATGHYTQLMWHDTSFIGCGRRDYGYTKIYVCNYGPTGNWINEPMYIIGEPCSKCPKGRSCSDNLCEVKSADHNRRDNSAPVTEPTTVKEMDSLNSTKGYDTKKGHDCDSENEKEIVTKPVINTKHKYGVVHHPTPSPSLKANSIENEYPLDAETKGGIEDIKLKIEKLVQKVIKNVIEKH